MNKDRRFTIEQISKEIDLAWSSYQWIFAEVLYMGRRLPTLAHQNKKKEKQDKYDIFQFPELDKN